ncbi:MAG: DegV family protein [Asgard group archaeon]|nr:DegV family protein [Asgard group archaeon]
MNNKTKKSLGIIADSTCDINPDFAKKYDIRQIPLKIIFGDEVKQQNIDITNEEFYQRLLDGEMPTTGAPSPKAVKEVIDGALADFDEVIIFSVGDKLSATYSTIMMVVKQFFDERVTVINTNTLSITMSLLILPAARMLEKGATKQEILDYVNTIIPHTQVFGGANTLKYLHKGGRLSKASYLIGSVLHLKPMITVDNGLIASPGKIRSIEALIDHMKNINYRIADYHLTETVIVGHCANPEAAEIVVNHLKSLEKAPKEVLLWDIGPVIGSHLGPGTIGIVWVGDFHDEWVKTKIDLRFWKKTKEDKPVEESTK